MVAQSIVYEFCASGAIERSIETVKAALAERAQTLANALRSELPDAEFVRPQGGYFMWVTLPQGTDVHALFHAAAERGVAFVKGTDFLLEGGENTLRLAYSGVTPEQIDDGRRAAGRRLPLALAAVALAQHELLRQRGARRRRRVGDDGDGLGDAGGETEAPSVGGAQLDVLGPALGDDGLESRLDAGGLQVVQEVLGLVLEAQHAYGGADLDVGERDAGAGARRRRWVAVGAGLGVADGGEHALLEHGRHGVLEALGLLVDLVPGHAENVGEEALDQAVAADDAFGVRGAVVGEGDRAV